MSGHPAVEAVARYLCRDYWCNEERWYEFVEQARAVVQIVETARRPYTPWSEVKTRRYESLGQPSCAQCGAMPWRPHAEDCPTLDEEARVADQCPAKGIDSRTRAVLDCQHDEGHDGPHQQGDSYWVAGAPDHVLSEALAEEVVELGRIARVWAVGDPEPEDRPTVRDKDGDEWFPLEVEGWKREGIAPPYSWKSMLVAWGPVTEVWTP